MPELPEAEANRRRIEAMCLNRTIEDASPGDNVKHLELPEDNERKRLIGGQFTQARRHGKMVFAGSASGPWIAVHLGMTGRLEPRVEGEEPPPDAKFVIRFEGGTRMYFLNKRKLGWLRVIEDPDSFIEENSYGPDALSISHERFCSLLAATRGAVKARLMDQKKLAGLGNLWSDEICFASGVAPARCGSDLSPAQCDTMFTTMREVLARLIEVASNRDRLPGNWLIHHREKGSGCPRCKGTIASRTIGGRTSYFCDTHQK